VTYYKQIFTTVAVALHVYCIGINCYTTVFDFKIKMTTFVQQLKLSRHVTLSCDQELTLMYKVYETLILVM